MTAFAGRAGALAGAASRVLAWTPDTFWAATPSDLMLALGGGEIAEEGLDRARLDALRAAMPDEGK